MKTRAGLILVLWMGLVAGSPAGAAIIAFWEPVTITPQAISNDPALANMQSWDLMVMTTGNWTAAGLGAVLSSNLTFYRHPLGGQTRPDRESFGLFPALEFTTYVSAPSDDGINHNTLIIGGHPQSFPASVGDSTSASPGRFSMAWTDPFVVDPAGTYQIARLTFPVAVIPALVHGVDPSRTSQISPESTTIIPGIPEPSTLCLWLVVTGAILFHYRNRSTG